ncbi:DUF2637 domain-containing protein [Micromonospora sp. CPCC 205714]|uniref:DUF2637 domain-containing protein n=1 Tax=Micromonospora sp. CPCC 205714 TaxID=3122402 RepID=UPI003FA5C1E7
MRRGSYDHMRTLALEAGQTPFLATILPLSVDGMILVATLALGDGRRSRWSAWLALPGRRSRFPGRQRHSC